MGIYISINTTIMTISIGAKDIHGNLILFIYLDIVWETSVFVH